MNQIGIDLGGTKIEAAALDGNGEYLARLRVPTPSDYNAAVTAVVELVSRLEAEVGPVDRFGVGLPGSPSPRTGLVRNANATFLNGRPFERDLATASQKLVSIANDANCLALSEATDGAGADGACVFAVILGTGCGGGLVIDGKLIAGLNGIAGEWGHNPLPAPGVDELPGPICWCGKRSCIERWVSGTGVQAAYSCVTGQDRTAEQIISAMRDGDTTASLVVDQWADRLGRSLAVMINLVDPDIIVFGGGLANISELYARLPEAVRPHIFSDHWSSTFRPAKWGDSSGVRGAAWLPSAQKAAIRRLGSQGLR